MTDLSTPGMQADTGSATQPAESGASHDGASRFTADLGAPAWQSNQSDASAIAFAAILAGAAILAIVSLIAGLMGSPQFSIGLGLGVAAGAVPYLIFVAVHAISSESSGHGQRRRHMTQDEWERVFRTTRKAAGDDPDQARSSTNQWSSAPSVSERAALLQSAYDLLEVAPAAGSRDVRSAYHRLAQLHHPDKVAHESGEAKEAAEKLMRELNAAYALIRDARARRGIFQN
jgi:hypothetical protein